VKHITRRGAVATLLGTSAAFSSFRARAQAGPIRIAVLQPLSGSLAVIGNNALMGARLAVREINDSGGIGGRNVELVVRDTKASSTEIVALMRDLAGSGINLIVGDSLSVTNLAAFPLAPSLGVVYVISSTIAMELTHELYNRNCFRAYLNPHMEFLAEAKLLADRHSDVRRWGTLLVDSIGYRTPQAFLYHGLKKFYAVKGIDVELAEPVMAKLGATDYRTQVVQLVSQNLGGLIVAASGGESITFLKQARELGLLKAVSVIGDMLYQAQYGPTLRQDLPKNFWTCLNWTYESYKQYAKAKTFFALFRAETKQEIVDSYIANGYLACSTLIEGVKNAGSTATDAVIQSLETTPFDSIYGPIRFRPEDHQLLFNPGFVRLGPDDGPDGWKIHESVQIDWKDVIEPPSPGKRFEFT
jgi:branched-chain amino acid transport system substrate-binding protein